jgi:aspartyl-tRNA(Asn)/glutamyl-tRNA(Gln) amidotransferase subunit C
MDRKELEKLAGQSSLRFTESEYAQLSADMDELIKFVAPVFDTKVADGLEFLLENARSIDELRADEVKDSLPIEKALQNAPNKKDRYFVVPKVME